MRWANARDLVVERDPAPVLPPRAERTGQAEPCQPEHSFHGAPVGGEDEPGARVHDAQARVLGRSGGGLPGTDHIGQETPPKPAVLGEKLVAAVTVGAHCRTAHECDGLPEIGQRRGNSGSAIDARGKDLVLVCRGPPMIAQAGSREVNDGRKAGELTGVDRSRRRVPANLLAGSRLAADQVHRPRRLGRAGTPTARCRSVRTHR